ncbi:hypothetical protein O6H91_Y065500 [Diphasiastrum complanatum]|nr:hypothetical protein O6H91_Y065500 [Diphasiastrum complanatum]
MELEVRRVSGERTCFVALPLQVIYLLQESGNVLPSFLVLDIRLAVKNKETAPWYLAWAGASSKSQSIEVPDKLAECIGLPHGVKVRMKVQKNVFEAKSVAVEPATEDDWEILELNAEYLENHILSKVGVVQESQCFPVWVQGETVLILKVISTKPKAVVKLVQGTELIVAPKNRQSRTVPPEDVSAYKGKNALQAADPYYRIQEMDPSIVCSFQSGVDGISVMLTTALFISPLSAKKVSFTDRQLVVLAGPDVGKAAHSNIRKDSGSQELLHNDLKQELAVEENTEKERGMRRVVLQVIFWSGVARGHIMLPYPLQLFLGVKTHSRVKLRPYDHPAKELPSSVWICPVKLTTNRSWLSSEVGGMTGDMKSNTPKNVKELDRNMAKNGNVIDKNWSKHAKVLASAASRNNSLEIDDHEGVNHIKSKDPKALLSFWLAAQWAACSQLVPDNSAINIPVSIETIMCFEVNNIKRTHMEDEHVQSAKLTENHISSDAHHRPVSSYIHRKKRPQCQSVYFLLTMQSDKIISSSYKSVPQHQSETEPQNLCFLLHHHFLAGVHPNVDTRAETNNTVEVQIGQPRFLVCRNEISERDSPSLDSMSWLRKPALEVLARLKVLLSPTACEDMRKLGTPYPGGVLLHGPQVSYSSYVFRIAEEIIISVGSLL